MENSNEDILIKQMYKGSMIFSLILIMTGEFYWLPFSQSILLILWAVYCLYYLHMDA
jgi:hypothetical protein